MKKICCYYFLCLLGSALSFPALADIYMGTDASAPNSSPYSTPTQAGSSQGQSPTDANSSGTVTAQTPPPPGQFVATYSDSSSSFSRTQNPGVAQAPDFDSPTPQTVMPCGDANVSVDLIYGKGPLIPTPCPYQQLAPHKKMVTYHLSTGSLKENVERMVKQSAWGQVVWNVPNDYNWTGNISITATTIQGALNKLLEPYPVEAVFYETNHVVDIEPRRQA